jgi:S1/P1 Nuclease
MRMRICKSIFAFLALTMASTPVFAWGPDGHEMVGAIADRLLKPNAAQQVKQILKFTLQQAAPWPDCVRSIVRKDDGTNDSRNFDYLPSPFHPEYRTPCKIFESKEELDRMRDYARRNWLNCTYIIGKAGNCHEAFHFADVALQRDGYDRRHVGTNDHDIVSAINAAIFVLQGRPVPPPPFFIKDKQEALFLLAHFVGDIHQPLHVGAVYLDANGTRVDPDRDGLDRDTETNGGNLINFGAPHQNLHSAWDDIPDKWGNTPDEAMLADARAVPPTSGPISGWAASWASDTLKQARDAFAPLKFSAVDNGRWTAQVADKPAYDQEAEKIKRAQLAKGGARLAQVLNSIWP